MLLSAAADLLLGGTCLGCGRPGMWLCETCRAATVPKPFAVSRPGMPEPIWAAGEYDGVLRALLPAYKDEQAMQLATVLGRLLAAAVIRVPGAAGASLVPLPSDPVAVRRRGDAHTVRLARAAAAWLSTPMPVRTLLRSTRRSEQVGLGADARAANLTGSMCARPGAGRVVICDDIVTTGASLAEARRALVAAGYQVVGAAVVAHTRRRDEAAG